MIISFEGKRQVTTYRVDIVPIPRLWLHPMYRKTKGAVDLAGNALSVQASNSLLSTGVQLI